MKIIIDDNKKISVLQEEFNAVFPYLKLELFSTSHKIGKGSAKQYLNHNSQTLGECRTIHNMGEIILNPQTTVAALEQGFKDVYGLGVQVFRKSGKVWLETTITDGWTLEEQNRQGEALSKKAG
jgi:hypothetical protein